LSNEKAIGFSPGSTKDDDSPGDNDSAARRAASPLAPDQRTGTQQSRVRDVPCPHGRGRGSVVARIVYEKGGWCGLSSDPSDATSPFVSRWSVRPIPLRSSLSNRSQFSAANSLSTKVQRHLSVDRTQSCCEDS